MILRYFINVKCFKNIFIFQVHLEYNDVTVVKNPISHLEWPSFAPVHFLWMEESTLKIKVLSVYSAVKL